MANTTTNIFVMDLTIPEIIDLTATPRRRRGRLLPPPMASRLRQERVRRAMEAIDLALAMSLSNQQEDSDEEDEEEDSHLERAIEESQQFTITRQQNRKRLRDANADLCVGCLMPVRRGDMMCSEC